MFDSHPTLSYVLLMIVFVHGVPETAAIWAKIRGLINRESVALSLPGFGVPRPDGFAATKDAYATWLLAELKAIGEPVHLVGHDWGAGLAYRVATTAPEHLRSWAIDVANVVHADYQWHDFAKIWQTPGDGEAFFANRLDITVEESAAGLAAMGVGPDDAREMARSQDQTMADCILALYRSATPNIHADWGPPQPCEVRGLVITPDEDPFADADMAAETAAALGASTATLVGAGHFWPYQAPEAAAELLTGFWDS